MNQLSINDVIAESVSVTSYITDVAREDSLADCDADAARSVLDSMQDAVKELGDIVAVFALLHMRNVV